jgi:LuxR family quorum-sensing system transcriptional regulator SolR
VALASWREQCLIRLGEAATSLDDLVTAMRGVTAQLGFEYCSYIYRLPLPIVQPAVHWCSTYPAAWLERSFEQQYLDIDPLVHRALQGNRPVVWGDDGNDDQPQFWEEARSFGIGHGWAVSARGHGGAVGLLSVARPRDPVTAAEQESHETQLLWLAHTAQGLVTTLPGMAGPTLGTLSLREREVLRWSAAGKTADEIGVILAITPRTVAFHVQRCVAKLDAANKTEAVAKALMLGLL